MSDQTTAAMGLSNRSLGHLDTRVAVPRYARNGLIPGIVHIGVGGFNRSHLAVYLDDLLTLNAGATGRRERWAEFGVGLLSADREIHEALASQDYLYGVLERGEGAASYRVIGSLVGHHYAPESPENVIRQMASPECKIISLTVTEAGYFLDDTTRSFRADDPTVQQDLERSINPATWLGYVTAAAERRMHEGGAPFTLMSCDNLQANGEAARAALLGFVQLREVSSGRTAALSDWIEANVTFPNSMVDRITPRTTEGDRELIANRFGVRDRTPVVTEPFRQWVLEEKFAAGRPEWELVGVTMAAGVEQYEKTKMRLLNGGHFCIAYFAAMLAIQTVSEALEDPQLRRLLVQFLAEVRTTLVDLPGIDLEQYALSVVKRFVNPAIKDQIARICADGPAKVTKFILPSLEEMWGMGAMPNVLPLVVASWLEYEERATGSHATETVMRVFAQRAPDCVAMIRKQQELLRTIGVRATLAKNLEPTEGRER